jgi:hypothetical protein
MRSRIAFLATIPLALALGGCFSSSSGGNGLGNDAGLPNGDDSGLPTIVDSGTGDATTGSDGGGDGGTETVTTTPIDFGTAGCGSAPSPAMKTYSLENTGPVPITYSATASSIFSISGPASGTVAPGATGSITIVAGTVPTSTNPGFSVSGTLAITTNIPGFTNVSVPLTVTAQGGQLVAPATVGFGSQQVNTTSSPLSFALQNIGNAPVSVSFGTPSDGEFSITGGGSIAPGATLTGASATFSPSSAGAKSATAAVNVTGALCATPPNLSIPLSGTGTTAQVSIGPSPLSFGSVACGQTAAPQTVTIKNGYTTPITYTAALAGAPSPFSISSTGGSVPANGQVAITVTPAAIPATGANLAAGGYSDTLTVGTSAPGTTPLAIPLTETASGVILALNMANTNFGTVTSSATLPFSVVNTGNATANVGTTVTGTGFSASLTSSTAGGGATDNGNAVFTAIGNGNFTGTLAVTTTSPLCAPLPPAITMTATGAVPVISAPAAVAVTATCGVASIGMSAQGAPQQNQAAATGTTTNITLLNSGNAGASYSVTGTTGTNFTVTSGGSGTIPAGGNATIVVTGTVPAGAAGGATPTGTLTFTTSEANNPVHTVTINSTIYGANLLTAPAPFTVPACNGAFYTIWNSGNVNPANPQPPSVQGGAGYCSSFATEGSCGNYDFDYCPDNCTAGTFVNLVSVPPSATSAGGVTDNVYSDWSNASCTTSPATASYFVSAGPVCQTGGMAGAGHLVLNINFANNACFCEG